MVANVPFAVVVGLLGSVILIMAVNTAYVASSELLERVAHRYRVALARRDQPARLALSHPPAERRALHRASSCSRAGSQSILAEMYAIGLLASFCINIGCLLIYRYFRGTKEISAYYTSRTGHPAARDHPGRLLHLPRRRTSRTGPRLWATRRGRHPRRRPAVLAPLRAGARGGAAERLPDGAAPRARRGRRPAATSTSAARASSKRRSRAAGTAFVTFFSPRQTIPDKAAPEPLPLPDPGRQRVRAASSRCSS